MSNCLMLFIGIGLGRLVIQTLPVAYIVVLWGTRRGTQAIPINIRKIGKERPFAVIRKVLSIG